MDKELQYKEETNEKNIKELKLEDDFLFAKVMSDQAICKKVIEKILNITLRK